MGRTNRKTILMLGECFIPARPFLFKITEVGKLFRRPESLIRRT